MTSAETLVAVIGWSHLLQLPITLCMKRRVLGVVSPFAGLPVLTKRVTDIMALASVYVPMLVGLVIAQDPAGAFSPSPIRTLALGIVAGLWCPRLIAQLLYVGPVFPRAARAWHWLLVGIFCVQGPVFLGVLIGGSASPPSSLAPPPIPFGSASGDHDNMDEPGMRCHVRSTRVVADGSTR